MEMNYEDRSKYFKALLLLVGKDGHITKSERSFLLEIGRILNFEASFCEETIDNLLRNKYMQDDPPEFSDKDLAKTFIKEGVRVAFIDNLLHIYEFEWLQNIVQKNGISHQWFSEEINSFLQKTDKNISKPYEIEKYLSLVAA